MYKKAELVNAAKNVQKPPVEKGKGKRGGGGRKEEKKAGRKKTKRKNRKRRKIKALQKKTSRKKDRKKIRQSGEKHLAACSGLKGSTVDLCFAIC